MKKGLMLSIILIVFLSSFIIQNKAFKNQSTISKAAAVVEYKDELIDIKEKRRNLLEENKYQFLSNTNDKKVFYSGKAVVLTYHHISNKPFSGITITPERFESDLKMLKDNGFNVVSLGYLIKSLYGETKLPNNAVVITFDDGIESFYKYGYPILKNYNMPAVNFIITARTEAYVPSSEDFNPLSKDEIKEMYESGLVDIQSHSHNSHDLIYKNAELKTGGKLAYRIYDKNTNTFESEENYIKRIAEDLKTSRDLIKSYTGVDSVMLCFPFGHYNKTVVDTARKIGFKYFVTTVSGSAKENSMSQYILRIRAGDEKLTSEQLKKNIIDCATKVKKR